MSKVLENLLYTNSHEWVKVDGNEATIGITDFAQHSLGSIVYVETGEVGDNIVKEESFGAVESVKAASDIISPISGKIIEVNEEVIDSPELLNEDAFEYWLIKVTIEDIEELKDLLNSNEYEAICK